MGNRERTYRLSKAARMATDAESGVLLDVKRGRYYSLTPSAVHICRAIAAGASFEAALDILQQRYPVPSERLAGDLVEFLTLLRMRGLCDVEGR